MVPLKYNLRSLFVRKVTTFVAAFGIAMVVFVLASSFMLSEGIKRTMGSAGRPDVAIVMRKGSDAELASGIDDPQVGVIKSMPGVKRDGESALGFGEIVVVAAMEKLGANGVSNVQLRGVTPDVDKLRPNVKVIRGRKPTPGADEVMVGRGIEGRFRGLGLNQSFEIKKNRPVTVVGVFEDNGSAHESEVWVDLQVMKTSFGREGVVSSVRVVLDSPAAFDAFQAAVEQDKRAGFMALRETVYYEKQSEGTSIFIQVHFGLIAVFVAIGAIIGATITMYATVANRQREIGTLRALGFSRFGILISFLFESVVLALMGGAMGSVAALGMSFVKLPIVNFASFSEMVFTFEPTPSIMITSLIFALGMGIIGGFLPAVRAAGVSPLAALKG
ncbi:MAG: ABC transporter permease [Polyangiaceae bacterium]|nr:ABC transporter permease [Polyangiaceae bacterium]